MSPVSGLVTTTIGSSAALLIGAKSLKGSYLTLSPSRMAFTSSDKDEKSSVVPSAAERATASVAMIAFAPGRFSTITGWPSATLMSCAMTRAMTSVGPPAANPTRTFTGLDGYACARTCVAKSRLASAAANGGIFMGDLQWRGEKRSAITWQRLMSRGSSAV